MSRLRVDAFGISIDGYGAGPGQALDHPMGVGGMALHEWVGGFERFWSESFARLDAFVRELAEKERKP